MEELLINYTLEDILIFLVIFAIAAKGAIEFFDWAKERLGKGFNKRHNEETNLQSIKNEIQSLNQSLIIANENQDNLKKLMTILLESDKDDIKAWITEKHHFFCYEQKYIDDYSLDCLEKRFKHYVDEGGNSFVEDLMNDIRKLPKVSTYINTSSSDEENK